MDLFVVLPIDKRTPNACKYWLGVKYHNRISNKLEEKRKKMSISNF
jgi:hypothetical protein